MTQSKQELLWGLFYKLNPFFGAIDSLSKLESTKKEVSEKTYLQKDYTEENENILTLQKRWRSLTSATSKIKVTAESKHLPNATRFMLNLKTDEEIKKVLCDAAKKNRLNTNHVITLLHQENALRCAYELFKTGMITQKQHLRIIELYEQSVKQEHKIYKSMDIKKIKELAELLHNGLENVKDKQDKDKFKELKALLAEDNFPTLVAGLSDSTKNQGLLNQQLLTLLELYQAGKQRTYPYEGKIINSVKPLVTEIYYILDEEGQFTEEATKRLLPKLLAQEKHLANAPIDRRLQAIDDKDLEQFKSLVSSLPRSEQIFYGVGIGMPRGVTNSVTTENAIYRDAEDDHYFAKDGTSHQHFAIPSCGVRNAIGILRYGVEDYIPVIGQAGIKSTTDIEVGQTDYHGRLGYLFYPNTPDPETIHRSGDDTFIGVFAHDIYHSDIVSSLPAFAKKGLKKFVDTVRNKTDIETSSPIWTWIDADYRYFKTPQYDKTHSQDQNIVHFVSMLDSVQLNSSEITYGYIIREKSGITEEGMLILYDMVTNPQSWKDIGLDPDYLPTADQNRIPATNRSGSLHKPSNYQMYFKQLSELAKEHSIDNKPIASQLLIMGVYISQDPKPSINVFKDFIKFVDMLQNKNLLQLIKDKQGNIHLTLDKKTIYIDKSDNYKDLHLIINMFNEHQHNPKYKVDVQPLINKFREDKIPNTDYKLGDPSLNLKNHLNEILKKIEAHPITPVLVKIKSLIASLKMDGSSKLTYKEYNEIATEIELLLTGKCKPLPGNRFLGQDPITQTTASFYQEIIVLLDEISIDMKDELTSQPNESSFRNL